MAKRHPQEEALFAISEQTGQIVSHDFSDSHELVVPLNERSVHLQNSITYLAHMSMLKGFLSYEGIAEREYGERAESVRQSVADRVPAVLLDAKKEFAAAVGYYDMIETGEDRQKTKRLTRGMFSDFLKKYYGSRNYEAAQDYRRQLTANLDPQQNPRPVEEEAPRVVREIGPDEKLTNHEKLEVLLTDPNAGFLPATNREKTTALTLLSYVNSSLGTNQQRLEIFNNAERNGGHGIRAIESVMYESGDYVANALQSHQRLQHLQVDVNDTFNPNLTLEVAFGEHHPGYAPLLRYFELRKLFDAEHEKVLPYPVDPMKTVEERWKKEGEGKHKIIHDRYTVISQEERIKEEIQEFNKTTRVIDARRMLPDALCNEEVRAECFTEWLRDLQKLGNVSRIFKDVVRATLDVILENEAA